VHGILQGIPPDETQRHEVLGCLQAFVTPGGRGEQRIPLSDNWHLIMLLAKSG
jgi:hypothetical protein